MTQGIDSSGVIQTTAQANSAAPLGTPATAPEQQVMDMMFETGMRSVEAQDKILADFYSQMSDQTQKLQDLNDLQMTINDMLQTLRDGGEIPAATIKKYDELIAKFPDLGAKYTSSTGIAQLETVQKNVSAEQSSQGAINEELTLKLNQAASQRSTIFTQLQTLLQTIMQARAALARW
jgi:hypothetical protein